MALVALTTSNGMLAYLKGSHFPRCSRVEQLQGGSSGFVYRVMTGDDARPTVIVKHAEGYAARAPQWKLDQNRMSFEARAMEYLSQPEMQADRTIRVPKLLHCDRENHVLIMEDAGPLPSLKTWTTEAKSIDECEDIGAAVGRFLAHLHNATYDDTALLSTFNGNSTAKYLSGKLYFGGLPAAATKFGLEDDFITEAAKAGEEEVMHSAEVLTMGDFWTGNVLVSWGAGERDLYVLDWELSKPGTAEFDIGQMAAEMWCLATFRQGAAAQGVALLRAFLDAYRATRSMAVDAAKVAVRIGGHLLVIMPMAWSGEASAEQIQQAAADGREFVRMGWENDEGALRQSVLAPLLS